MKFKFAAVVRLHRWLLVLAFLSLVVLALNLALLIVSSRLPATHDGTNILMRADCTSISRWNVLSHLIINIMDTVLLAASNYAMQLAIAPTRDDVDAAHARRRWLNIGVPSARNVRAVSPPRRLCWAALLLSSFPLHLVYNSAVLASQATTEYIVAELDASFLDDVSTAVAALEANWNIIGENPNAKWPGYAEESRARREYFRDAIVPSAARWDNLTLEACASTYSGVMLTTHRNLVLVVPPEDPPRRLPGLVDEVAHNNWMCDAGFSWNPACRPGRARFGVPDRARNLTPVEPAYCLAEPFRQQCDLEVYAPFLVTVVACNVVKTVAMLALFSIAKGRSLNTLGDAITSFLKQPDPSTKGFGAYDYRPMLALWEAPAQPDPIPWTRRKKRWLHAVSRGRLWLTWAGFIAAVAVVLGLLIMAVAADYNSGRLATSLSPSSFLAKDYTSVVGWEALAGASFASLVVLVNTPQVLFSALYFIYNGLLSCLLQAAEWNALSLKPRTLRVSQPERGQRPAYSLQVPPAYALPLLAFSAASHWLISQSLFLSKITFAGYRGQMTHSTGRLNWGRADSGREGQILVANYSSLYLVCSLAAGVIALVSLLLVSLKRLAGDMVLQSGCSAAIAAACQHARQRGETQPLRETCGYKQQEQELVESVGEDEDEDWTRPLMWGEIRGTVEGESGVKERRCLGLAAGSVGEVVEGRQYS